MRTLLPPWRVPEGPERDAYVAALLEAGFTAADWPGPPTEEKYNPSQPRDAHGRWTTGGAAGGAAGGASRSLTITYEAPSWQTTGEDTRRSLAQALGKESVTDDDIAGLAGQPGNAAITVKNNGGSPYLVAHGDTGRWEVQLDRRDGKTELYVSLVEAYPTGQGNGTRGFATMVETSQRLGVDVIKLDASRGDNVNGYYTWARLGFNRDNLPADITWRNNATRYNSDYREVTLPPWASHVTTMHDLMATPADAGHPSGAAWWKENGFSWDGEFTPKAGSEDTAILKAYLKERGQENPGIKQAIKRLFPLNPPGGAEIEWTDADEAAAERAWRTFADSRVKTASVPDTKYSPSQARDAHGRWTTGWSLSSLPPMNGLMFRTRHPKVQLIGMDRIPKGAREQIFATADALIDRYPSAGRGLRALTCQELSIPDASLKGILAETTSFEDYSEYTSGRAPTGHTIRFNPFFFEAPGVQDYLGAMEPTGQWPPGCANAGGIMAHEFGHVFYHRAMVTGSFETASDLNHLVGFSKPEDRQAVSLYAGTRPTEAFAEGFAAVHESPKAFVQSHTYTRDVQTFLDKHYPPGGKDGSA